MQIFAVIARSTAEISRGGGPLGPPPPCFSSYQNSPVFLGLISYFAILSPSLLDIHKNDKMLPCKASKGKLWAGLGFVWVKKYAWSIDVRVKTGLFLEIDLGPNPMVIGVKIFIHKPCETNANWHCMVTHGRLCYSCLLSGRACGWIAQL